MALVLRDAPTCPRIALTWKNIKCCSSVGLLIYHNPHDIILIIFETRQSQNQNGQISPGPSPTVGSNCHRGAGWWAAKHCTAPRHSSEPRHNCDANDDWLRQRLKGNCCGNHHREKTWENQGFLLIHPIDRWDCSFKMEMRRVDYSTVVKLFIVGIL